MAGGLCFFGQGEYVEYLCKRDVEFPGHFGHGE